MKISGLSLLACVCVFAQDKKDDEVVFRSDTTLVRVDVQVLDRDNRPVAGLEREAFNFREQGQQRAIKNFVREELPIDLLFLIDVSGSMRPHVERMAEAAHRSLPSMRKEDRISVMVFDRATRVRMPFRSGPAEAQREFDNLLRHETFSGGTDITRALLDAGQYMKRQGRKEARRAIVLLTDDQTESQFEVDEERVVQALNSADTVLSALLVPNMMGQQGRGIPAGGGGGGYPRGGGGGRRGGGIGGLGGVIIGGGGYPGGGYPGGGRRGGGGYPGGGYPGGGGGQGGGGSRTLSAGSAQIARESGGDSMQADESVALETTLNRLRQRYALYFNLPAGVVAGDRRSVDIQLEDSVARRYPDATVRYRRSYVAAASSGSGAPTEEVLETVPLRPEPRTAPPVSRRRTMDGSSSSGPGIVVH